MNRSLTESGYMTLYAFVGTRVIGHEGKATALSRGLWPQRFITSRKRLSQTARICSDELAGVRGTIEWPITHPNIPTSGLMPSVVKFDAEW